MEKTTATELYLGLKANVSNFLRWSFHSLLFFTFVFSIFVRTGNKILPMIGFEKWISGIGSDTNSSPLKKKTREQQF